MKRKKIRIIENPYQNISESEYQVEKRRLQVELLKIQQWLVHQKLSLVVVFEGRDAAGKGSTIKRFTENLMPAHFSIHALGVPTESESKYWFRRYESIFPKPGNIAFFDRSWYSRALIEPTMVGSINALEYQDRSKKAMLPGLGKIDSYRLNQYLDSDSVGTPSAWIEKCAGIRFSVKRLMVEPLPAASLPSKTTTRESFWWTNHCWIFNSSTCSRRFSTWYSLSLIFW
jgi:hypothetical protein